MKSKGFLAAVFSLALMIGQAATLTVTTTADSGAGSLRQAILDSNATNGDDTISFAVNGTITLASTLPTVTDNTAISGPGANLLTISGNSSVNVFMLAAGTTNTIFGVTIANGRATNYLNGAAIANGGRLAILNCAFTNNQTFGGFGGAIFSLGGLALINSTFAGNLVTGENGSGSSFNTAGGGGGAGLGGALFSMAGNVFINGCSFTNNSATGGNGGDAPNGSGNGCGGGPQRGCACVNGGFGSGGGGAFANQCHGGNGGFGGGGGGAAGQPEPAGAGGFGGGGGGTFDYAAGGGGSGIGGAIFVDSGTVTIVDSFFSGNDVLGGTGGWGGNKYIDPLLNAARAGANGSGIGPDFFTRTGTVMPTLTASTLGGGTVTVDPPNPPYLSNSWALVTATPASGWRFLYWLGDATGTNEAINVKVTRDKYVQAVFGTTVTNAALISVYPQSDFYPYGTLAKFTALPPAGTYFAAWSGDASGTNNPLSLVVTNPNQNISYQLGALSGGQFALTVVENGRGRVEISPRAYRFNSGEMVTLSAVPEASQDFIGWSGNAGGSTNQVVITMDQSKVINADFTKRPTLRVGTPLEGLSEDGFRLTILGEFGTPYTISGSTNLADWNAVGTVTNIYGAVQLTDAQATNLPSRFYKTGQ